jgi:hypothetical protein
MGYTPNRTNDTYEVFHPFLASQTWHGTKQADRERFYLAPDKVAREAAFDPEEMGDYLRARLGLPSGDDHDDNAVAGGSPMRPAGHRCMAVRDFLVITGAAANI